MFDTGIFVGGMIWLWNSKETKEMDKVEKETKIKRATHSSGGIRYHDGLDIEHWL